MEVGTHPLRWDAALAKELGAYSDDSNKKGQSGLWILGSGTLETDGESQTKRKRKGMKEQR